MCLKLYMMSNVSLKIPHNPIVETLVNNCPKSFFVQLAITFNTQKSLEITVTDAKSATLRKSPRNFQPLKSIQLRKKRTNLRKLSIFHKKNKKEKNLNHYFNLQTFCLSFHHLRFILNKCFNKHCEIIPTSTYLLSYESYEPFPSSFEL